MTQQAAKNILTSETISLNTGNQSDNTLSLAI